MAKNTVGTNETITNEAAANSTELISSNSSSLTQNKYMGT